MATANLIKIGTIWLTADGTGTGVRCQTTVSGLEAVKATRSAAIHKALDGTPYRQAKTLKGKTLVISFPEYIAKAKFDAIFAAINTAENSDSTLLISISGDLGDFDLTVIPDDNWLRAPGEFVDGYIFNAAFAFLTT